MDKQFIRKLYRSFNMTLPPGMLMDMKLDAVVVTNETTGQEETICRKCARAIPNEYRVTGDNPAAVVRHPVGFYCVWCKEELPEL